MRLKRNKGKIQIMEDEKIINLFYARSEQAISELSTKYGTLAQGICTNILNNFSDAEECVSDSLYTTWNSIPPESPKSLKAFFIRVARNKALDRYRFNTSSKRNSYADTPLEELQECLSSRSSIEAECEAEELSVAINSFLGSLEKLDRQMFVARYFLSDSVREIGEQMGLKESAIATRLFRIRAKLQKFLKEEKLI